LSLSCGYNMRVVAITRFSTFIFWMYHQIWLNIYTYGWISNNTVPFTMQHLPKHLGWKWGAIGNSLCWSPPSPSKVRNQLNFLGCRWHATYHLGKLGGANCNGGISYKFVVKGKGILFLECFISTNPNLLLGF
jgi:hypothetical protein